MAVNTDPGVQAILDNIQVIVASEGGSLEYIDMKGRAADREVSQGSE